MEQVLLVMVNVPDAACGEAIARLLLERQLAACVNCLPGVKSLYRWQGAIEEAAETTLLIKTTRASYAELEQTILSQHPYDTPEIIAVPIALGSSAYLDWIVKETRKGSLC